MTVIAEDTPVSRFPESDAPNSGILLLDKPTGITSHDAVDIVRRSYQTRRVGHAGTLDPMASGLLIIMVGQATKIARYLTGLSKTYTATIRLGWRSTTGDAEGELQPDGDVSGVTERQVADAVAAHQGHLIQLVPTYAAKRTKGQRRYDLARSGADVPELTQEITIHTLDLVAWHSPDAVVRVHCSSGTYVRSLGESIARTVNCGGYLTELRREAVGEWRVEDASSVDDLDVGPALQPINDFLLYPRLVLNEDSGGLVSQGRPIVRHIVTQVNGRFDEGERVVLSDTAGRVLAVGFAVNPSDVWVHLNDDDTVFRYERVLI